MSDRTDQAASTGSAVQFTAISDGDAFRTDELAARRRGHVTVADAEAAFRAELVTEFVTARKSGRDLIREAAKFDAAHPEQPSLLDELLATRLEAAA